MTLQARAIWPPIPQFGVGLSQQVPELEDSIDQNPGSGFEQKRETSASDTAQSRGAGPRRHVHFSPGGESRVLAPEWRGRGRSNPGRPAMTARLNYDGTMSAFRKRE